MFSVGCLFDGVLLCGRLRCVSSVEAITAAVVLRCAICFEGEVCLSF
jgi:hypothetical protein